MTTQTGEGVTTILIIFIVRQDEHGACTDMDRCRTIEFSKAVGTDIGEYGNSMLKQAS